ncbi:MAG: DUF4340 domain-containing protein [Myxococcota bacterium]
MKSVLIQGLLAMSSLVVAYLVWTDEDTESLREEVAVLDCDAQRIQSIRLKTPTREVAMSPRGEIDDRFWWIETRRVQPSAEPAVNAFVAGDAFDAYARNFGPLSARRDLGVVDAETLAELGFFVPAEDKAVNHEAAGDEAAKDDKAAKDADAGDDKAAGDAEAGDDEEKEPSTLALTCGDQEHAFELGGSAYGSGDRYLRTEHDRVYLVSADLVRNAETASSLMQRDLLNFEMSEVDMMVLLAFDEELRLKHYNRLDEAQADWVDANEPDRRNELYGNWMSQLSRLRATRYLEPDAEPGADLEGDVRVAPLATFVFLDESADELGRVELVRANSELDVEYYARSNATRGWVRTLRSLGKQVAEELRPLVGLDAAPEPEPVRMIPARSASDSASDGAGVRTPPHGHDKGDH